VLHQKQRTRIGACIATAEFEDVRIGSISDRSKIVIAEQELMFT